MVDKKNIAIKAAYELAFLKKDYQFILLEYIEKYKLNINKIREIRRGIESDQFSDIQDVKNYIETQIQKLCVPGTQSIRIDYKKIKKYIPSEIKEDKAEEYIIEAIKFYNANKS